MRRSLGIALVVAIGGFAVSALAWSTGALQRIEAQLVDARYQVRGESDPPSDFLLVQIDDRTLQETGAPLARTLHATLIDRLSDAGASRIAYDVPFSEAAGAQQPGDPGSERLARQKDAALLNAVSRSGRTVLSSALLAGGQPVVLGGIARLRAEGSDAGLSLYPTAPDGVYRRLATSIEGVKHFAVVAAGDGHGHDQTWIDFAGKPGTFPSVSALDVLADRVSPARIRGRFIVVGEDRERHPTSIGGGSMTRAEITANAIATVRDDYPLEDVPDWAALLAIALAALAPVLTVRPLARMGRPVLALAAFIGTATGMYLLAQLLFALGLVLPLAAPALALVVSLPGSAVPAFLEERMRRQQLRQLFARFVPADVVDEVIDVGGGGLRLGGVSRTGTVMFADLRDFTSLAERLPAGRVIQVLNRYLSEMSDAILDQRGTLVSYMGDGVMAVFGAPLEQADHADRALAAAREMVEVRLPRFNAWLEEEGLTAPGKGFRMGVGLNSGEVMSGNVGSDRRVEYAAVGLTTNCASRIEQLCKSTGRQLMLSENTRSALTREAPPLVPVGEHVLRGRQSPTLLWGLSGDEPVPADPSEIAGRRGA